MPRLNCLCLTTHQSVRDELLLGWLLCQFSVQEFVSLLLQSSLTELCFLQDPKLIYRDCKHSVKGSLCPFWFLKLCLLMCNFPSDLTKDTWLTCKENVRLFFAVISSETALGSETGTEMQLKSRAVLTKAGCALTGCSSLGTRAIIPPKELYLPLRLQWLQNFF